MSTKKDLIWSSD